MSDQCPRIAKQPALTEDQGQLRRLDCASYSDCLSEAAAEGWESFTCAGCVAYVQLDGEQRALDMVGLLALAAWITGERASPFEGGS